MINIEKLFKFVKKLLSKQKLEKLKINCIHQKKKNCFDLQKNKNSLLKKKKWIHL